MKDKICIVTGGNAGIGKATVAGLAQRGATVVIACRDVAKGRAALEEIAAKTGSKDLHVMQLDLASLGSVRAFAAALDDALAERLWTETERLVALTQEACL